MLINVSSHLTSVTSGASYLTLLVFMNKLSEHTVYLSVNNCKDNESAKQLADKLYKLMMGRNCEIISNPK